MTGFVVAVALVLAASCVALMLRWQLAAEAFPHFTLKQLFGESADERVERKRRHFLLSLVPLVAWSWILFLVLD